MFDRLVSSVVAVVLAFLVWLYVRSRDQQMLDNVPIPVQIMLAPGLEDHYELEVLGPSQIPVSFTAPLSPMRELRRLLRVGALRVEVSLNAPEETQTESSIVDTVRIEAGDIHPPPGVTTLVAEGRNRIPVKFHRLIERRLPVRLDCTAGNRVSRILVEPATVVVRGPQEALARTHAILTQPFALPLPDESATDVKVVTADSIPLVQQVEGRRIRAAPSTVAVRVVLPPQQKIYELANVPVGFLCPPNFSLRPLFQNEGAGKIKLRLSGPAGEETPAVIAVIDLFGRDWEPGMYQAALKLQLPPNFRLAQDPPARLAFELVPLERNE
jgi:hypothetical protein